MSVQAVHVSLVAEASLVETPGSGILDQRVEVSWNFCDITQI